MDYSGMTVNERLYVSGLINEFDLARMNKDKQKLIEILKKVKLDEYSINEILKSFRID